MPMTPARGGGPHRRTLPVSVFTPPPPTARCTRVGGRGAHLRRKDVAESPEHHAPQHEARREIAAIIPLGPGRKGRDGKAVEGRALSRAQATGG